MKTKLFTDVNHMCTFENNNTCIMVQMNLFDVFLESNIFKISEIKKSFDIFPAP